MMTYLTWDTSRDIATILDSYDFLKQVVLDCSLNAYGDPHFFSLLYEYFRKNKIPRNRLKYITSDYNAVRTNDEISKNYISDGLGKIEVDHHDYLLSNYRMLVEDGTTNVNIVTDDGMYEHHKSLFVMMLLQNGFVSNSNVNLMYPDVSPKVIRFLEWQSFQFKSAPYYEFCKDNFDEFISGIKPAVRKQSKFDVNVLDINAYKMRPVLHINSNVYESISRNVPFVVVGAPGSLNLIKSLGFKTFDSVFDEGYDYIDNNIHRLEYIARLICILDYQDIYNRCKSICEFNSAHLRKLQEYGKVSD